MSPFSKDSLLQLTLVQMAVKSSTIETTAVTIQSASIAWLLVVGSYALDMTRLKTGYLPNSSQNVGSEFSRI
jgi:hypothetical protein